MRWIWVLSAALLDVAQRGNAEPWTDPLTVTGLPQSKDAAIGSVINSVGAHALTDGVMIGPAYNSYTSHRATVTNTAILSAIQSAEEFLTTWRPHAGVDGEFATLIQSLPAYMQSYLVAFANLENSAAASVVNSIFNDGASASLALYAALPNSLQTLALTDPAAAASEISSEILAGTPTWFTNMPTDVESYFLTESGTGLEITPSATGLTRAFYVIDIAQFTSTNSRSMKSTGLPSPTPTSSQSELPTGVRVGLGVGSAIGACGLGILIFTLIRLNGAYRRKKKVEDNEKAGTSFGNSGARYEKAELDANQPTMSGAIQRVMSRYSSGSNTAVVHELAETNSIRGVEARPVALSPRYG